MNSCIFSGLDEKDLPQATQRVLQTPHTKGGTIFHHRTPVFGCYILYQGRAKLVVRAKNGKKVLFKFCRAGDLIDGVLLCGIEMHSTYAEALEDSGVCFIPKASFEELLQEYPQVSLEVIRRLSKDLAMLKKRLTDMSCKDVRERLIGLLLDLGREYGVEEEGGLLIDLALSQQDLAEMVGTSRQTVNQKLRRLEEKSLIMIAKRRITITNEKALKELCCLAIFSLLNSCHALGSLPRVHAPVACNLKPEFIYLVGYETNSRRDAERQLYLEFPSLCASRGLFARVRAKHMAIARPRNA